MPKEPDSDHLIAHVRTAREGLDKLLAYVAKQPPIPNLHTPTGYKPAPAFRLRDRAEYEVVHYAIGLRLLDEDRIEILTSWIPQSVGAETATAKEKDAFRELRRLGFRRGRGGSWVVTLDAKDDLGIDRAIRAATRALRGSFLWE